MEEKKWKKKNSKQKIFNVNQKNDLQAKHK